MARPPNGGTPGMVGPWGLAPGRRGMAGRPEARRDVRGPRAQPTSRGTSRPRRTTSSTPLQTRCFIAENTLAGSSTGTPYSAGHETNFACPLPNFAMFLASDDVCRTAHSDTDCLAGQLRPGYGPSSASDGKGWSRANQSGTFEDINFGQRLTVEGYVPVRQLAASGRESQHGLRGDGSVRYITATIDGTVYAKILTPAGGRLPPVCRQLPVQPREDFAQH